MLFKSSYSTLTVSVSFDMAAPFHVSFASTNYFDNRSNYIIVLTVCHCFNQKAKKQRFQLLTREYFMSFLVSYDSKLNIIGFWTVVQSKQDILEYHNGLWGRFSLFAITFY